MNRLLLFVVTGFVITSCAQSATIDLSRSMPDETVASTSSQLTTTQPSMALTFTGKGESNTDSFYAAGSLKVSWITNGNCVYILDLKPVNGDFRLQKTLLNFYGAGTGSNRVYSIENSLYFIEATTGPAPSCPWKVTLTSE